jgi:hypothetical protein
MSFINWGSESPEQLAIRKQIEEQALYEQAVFSALDLVYPLRDSNSHALRPMILSH